MQYYESPIYGEWCRRVYGRDLKQLGMVTMDELEVLYREVDLPPDARILDMGCGPGYLSAALAGHFHAHLTGIDIDAAAIAHARSTFSARPELEFQQADGNTVSFDDARFDLITFLDTLYFTGSPEKLCALLERCLAWLTPGGRLAIFWSNHPGSWFGVQAPAAESTPVGCWGRERQVAVKAVDLSEAYRKFWLKAQKETRAMRAALRREIPKTAETLLEECARYSSLCMQGEAGGMARWLYVCTRPGPL